MLHAVGNLIVEDCPGSNVVSRGLALLVCVSKNDRAEPLFRAVAALVPGAMQLGRITPSKATKLLGAITSISPNMAQTRSDMEFSPAVALAAQRLTEQKISSLRGVTHVLQWGAMYAPVRDARTISYSIVTDGPFDPDDASYPVEWKPRRWAAEYFARQRTIYREATLVFALSEWARRKLLALHDLEPQRVVRIGWGPMFDAAPSQPGDDSAAPKKLFVSIGNEWQRKGMDLVARAGARLHAEDGEVQAVVTGDPEGLTLEPAAGVTLLPRRLSLDEVESLLRSARALIVASRFDASPHIIVEALQLGVPVIGSDVCGIPEAVQPPIGGLTVPQGSDDELVEAMRSILAGDVSTQRDDALRAYAAMGGWPAVASRVVDALRSNGVL
ncbi:Glycosyltransferase involved in cell wall bisynthesis [Bryocella elongata]|uniref:Glycosyltransferase involved in cell wall bisynthesis n=2 Tax=Bryocella elongata TaxID=863522 RepID=A0A1H5SQ04_9BACT|nr:Glycosyltransferase involved in cell wall bisynthesis [Bryocella elongata]